MMSLTALLAIMAARSIAFGLPATFLLGALVAAAGVLSARFLSTEVPGRGKSLEMIGGIWSLVLYLSLGVIPIALRYWRHR